MKPDVDQVRAYLRSSRRSWRVNGVKPMRAVARADEGTVFIVGSPRSGTSFVAEVLGSVPGFADLGELRPLKRVIPELAAQPTALAAERVRRIILTAQRLGLSTGLRGIEQTPESTYLLPALAEAFPQARIIHMVRDGRDVASSLIGLGWVRSSNRVDEAGQAFGTHARFWVETDRRAEFEQASDATRAAWVWRRYETTAMANLVALADQAITVNYENLVQDPQAVAGRLAKFLGTSSTAAVVDAFSATTSRAMGRWRTDLAPDQLRDVIDEAGPLLEELGYKP